MCSAAENSWKLNKCLGTEPGIQTRTKKFPILENEDHISSSAIISLTVSDPRALSEEKVELVREGTSTGNLGYMKEDEDKDFSPSADISGKNTVPVSSTMLEIEEDSALSDSMDL